MDISTLIEKRERIVEDADGLTPGDIGFLVPLLNEKDDKLRYPAFLLLCGRSRKYPDVYPYWDEFLCKLDHANSFQRNIGVTLIGLNVRWDEKKLFEKCFRPFMSCCTDEKFITARLTIQTIPEWAKYVPELLDETAAILMSVEVGSLKDTQRKLILIDIMNALLAIREVRPSDKINAYLMNGLTGGLLDKKTAKQFESLI